VGGYSRQNELTHRGRDVWYTEKFLASQCGWTGNPRPGGTRDKAGEVASCCVKDLKGMRLAGRCETGCQAVAIMKCIRDKLRDPGVSLDERKREEVLWSSKNGTNMHFTFNVLFF
jgi:hypothetical protein